MKLLRTLLVAALATALPIAATAAETTLELKGREGPGHGRKIVLISGD